MEVIALIDNGFWSLFTNASTVGLTSTVGLIRMLVRTLIFVILTGYLKLGKWMRMIIVCTASYWLLREIMPFYCEQLKQLNFIDCCCYWRIKIFFNGECQFMKLNVIV